MLSLSWDTAGSILGQRNVKPKPRHPSLSSSSSISLGTTLGDGTFKSMGSANSTSYLLRMSGSQRDSAVKYG